MAVKHEVAANAAASTWTDITAYVDSKTAKVGGQGAKLQVGTGSGVDIDDDAGTRYLPGRRVYRVTEDATASPTQLFRGRVSEKGLGRGTEHAGDAKRIGAQFDDYNQDLWGIIVDGQSRPAETDDERVAWLLAKYLAGAGSTSTRARDSTDIADTYVSASGPVNLPAEVLTDTSPAQVLLDIIGITGKECFVTVDGELFYDVPTSTAYAADISITDVNPDGIDSYAPIWDGDAASEDPTEFLSGIKAKYLPGEHNNVSLSDGTAASTGDKWEEVRRLQTTSAAKAAAMAQVILDNQKVEEKRRMCAIQINADQVDRIKWGQTISFRAAAAGDLTPVTLRIARLMWDVPPTDDAPYIAHLELAFPKKVGARISGGSGAEEPGPPPGTNPFPFPSSCQRDDFNRTVANGLGNADYGGIPWSLALDVANPNSPNEFQVGAGVAVVDISDGNSVSNATLALGGATVNGDYYIDFSCDVDGSFIDDGDISLLVSESILQMRFIVDVVGKNEFSVTCTTGKWESLGVPQRSDQFVFIYPTVGSYTSLETPIAPNAGAFLFDADEVYQVRLHIEPGNSYVDINGTRLSAGDDLDLTDTDSITAAGIQIQLEQTGNQGGGYPGGSPNLTLAATTIYMVQYCSGTTEFPDSGQPVGPEIVGTGDGVETTFFTRFPYAPGSLKVYDGANRVFAIFETSPEDRQFDFAVAPTLGNTERAEYQGA